MLKMQYGKWEFTILGALGFISGAVLTVGITELIFFQENISKKTYIYLAVGITLAVLLSLLHFALLIPVGFSFLIFFIQSLFQILKNR